MFATPGICRPCLDSGKLPEAMPDPATRSSSSCSMGPLPSTASNQDSLPPQLATPHAPTVVNSSPPAVPLAVVPVGSVPPNTYSHLAAQNQEVVGSKEYQENIQRWYREHELGNAKQ